VTLDSELAPTIASDILRAVVWPSSQLVVEKFEPDL